MSDLMEWPDDAPEPGKPDNTATVVSLSWNTAFT